MGLCYFEGAESSKWFDLEQSKQIVKVFVSYIEDSLAIECGRFLSYDALLDGRDLQQVPAIC